MVVTTELTPRKKKRHKHGSMFVWFKFDYNNSKYCVRELWLQTKIVITHYNFVEVSEEPSMKEHQSLKQQNNKGGNDKKEGQKMEK